MFHFGKEKFYCVLNFVAVFYRMISFEFINQRRNFRLNNDYKRNTNLEKRRQKPPLNAFAKGSLSFLIH